MLASDCHECRGIRLWNMAKIRSQSQFAAALS